MTRFLTMTAVTCWGKVRIDRLMAPLLFQHEIKLAHRKYQLTSLTQRLKTLIVEKTADLSQETLKPQSAWRARNSHQQRQLVTDLDPVNGTPLKLLRFAKLVNSRPPDWRSLFGVLQQSFVKRQLLPVQTPINSTQTQDKIARLHAHLANVPKDFVDPPLFPPTPSVTVTENLQVLARLTQTGFFPLKFDLGFDQLDHPLESKTKQHKRQFSVALWGYPSLKIGSKGGVKNRILSLGTRICPCESSLEFSRDSKVAFNLVRLVQPEFTPVDRKEPTLVAIAEKFPFCQHTLVK